MNNTIVGYRSLQNEHNEKNRIRELEQMLASQRTKSDFERKANHEKNILIDELKDKLVQAGNREQKIVSQCEEKLNAFQTEFLMN